MHTRTSGVPAVPVFRDVTSGPGAGQVTVEIRTVASGVNNPVQGFQFVITPVLDGVNQDSRSFPRPIYDSSQYIALTIDGLKQGSVYTFSATATNIFGTSESANSRPVSVGMVLVCLL